MNSYLESIHHYTLDDGNYLPLLQFCINATVNLMISFPDIDRDVNGGFRSFDERSIIEPGVFMENKKYFGNRNAGIEVTVRSGKVDGAPPEAASDTVVAEAYGLPDRERVMVKSFRDAGESCFNRIIELHVTAPETKLPALMEMFRASFGNSDPDDEKIISLKKGAVAKLSRGMWEPAADDAEYLLLYRPDDPEFLAILGKARIGEGDWRGAKRSLLKAVEILPENCDAWYNLGLAYMSGSDNGSALHCFDKVLEFDHENHGAYYMKGVILEETGRGDEAVEAFRYAVKFSPGTHKARMNSSAVFTLQAEGALERLGSPWRGDEELPDPEGIDINEDIIRASSRGDVRSIGKLVKKGGVLDYRSRDKSVHGRTPLIVAALNGHFHTVNYLLEHGAGVDYNDENGCTPLGSVLEWGDSYEIIKLLIDGGADVNGKDPYRRPLILNEKSLGDPAILAALAEAGADLNAVDEHGANGLMGASSAGNVSSVEFFLGHGVDVNSRNRSGATPLIIAVAKGNRELAGVLLKRGADANASDREGISALMIAAEHADAETLALLMAAGADVNKRDMAGRSAMDILMESGKRDDMESFRRCVDLLADAGAELAHGRGSGPEN